MRVLFSCVLDNNPRIAYQAYLWALTLLHSAKRQPDEIVVHYIETTQAAYLDRLRPLGVHLVPVKPFDPSHPPSNKLAQLNSDLLGQADYVVLTDCDIAFTSDIAEVLAGERVRAKIVDDASLAPSHWKALYKMAGLGKPDLDVIALNDKKPTVANFCNGGFLVLPKAIYHKLGEAWPKWNRELLAHPEPLGQWTYYTDQVSFALALQELGETVDPLPETYNYPTHKQSRSANLPAEKPKVLHYHGEVDASGYLLRSGVPAVDDAIGQVNTLITQQTGRGDPNAARPDLGSGVGSRGHDLLVKRRLLSYVVEQLSPKSVLDVGCGDLELTRELQVDRYTGTDISAVAVGIAKAKRPYWSFEAGDALELDLRPHDMVLCFDVAIHQPTEETYRKLCRRLQDLTERYLVIAGYNQPPWFSSAITFYYEPLSETLRQAGGDLAILGGYRDTTVLLWSRNGPPAWKDDTAVINKPVPLIRKMASRVKRAVVARQKK